MSRIQLALRVSDVDRAVDYYRELLGTDPHKRRPGYANFAVADPPLKLVLIESEGGGTLDHLGIEVEDTDGVARAIGRLGAAGLDLDTRTAEMCCHAVQDKVWTADPDGARWEVYTILDDQPDAPAADTAGASAASPLPRADAAAAGAACSTAGCC